MSEQYYLFTLPGDDLVWCEMFVNVGHFVAPTPYTDMDVALQALTIAHHDATVDTLCDSAEIDEVRTWARTCPLEPLPV